MISSPRRIRTKDDITMVQTVLGFRNKTCADAKPRIRRMAGGAAHTEILGDLREHRKLNPRKQNKQTEKPRDEKQRKAESERESICQFC